MEVDEFLEHHGILGMRWGVRKGVIGVEALNGSHPGHAGALVAPGVKSLTVKEQNKVRIKTTKVADNFLIKLDKDNVIPGFTQDFREKHNKSQGPITGKLRDQYEKEFSDRLMPSLKSVLPRGTDGFVKLQDDTFHLFVGDPKTIREFKNKVVHAMDELVFRVIRDEDGFITALEPMQMMQNDSVAEFLEHFGVRGMHWGIRRSKAELSRGSSGSSSGKPPWQSAPVRKPPPSIAGHSPHTPHDQVVYEALKAKAREHGIHSLSNEEIRILTNRAETLRKAYTAFPKKQTKSQKLGKRAGKIIDNVLINTGEQLLKDVVKFKGENILIDKGKLPPRKKRVVTETSVN